MKTCSIRAGKVPHGSDDNARQRHAPLPDMRVVEIYFNGVAARSDDRSTYGPLDQKLDVWQARFNPTHSGACLISRDEMRITGEAGRAAACWRLQETDIRVVVTQSTKVP